MMILETLGRNARAFRQTRGLTQQALAERAGISLVFLQGIEAGKKWVSAETISALARSLGVRETELFAETRVEAGARPDPREVLALIPEALGVALPPGLLERAKVSPYRLLLRERAVGRKGHIDLSHMPEDLFYDMVTLCQEPGCEWERFREALRSVRARR
jgi:transcriptional regulator with XRE-family HTH domain